MTCRVKGSRLTNLRVQQSRYPILHTHKKWGVQITQNVQTKGSWTHKRGKTLTLVPNIKLPLFAKIAQFLSHGCHQHFNLNVNSSFCWISCMTFKKTIEMYIGYQYNQLPLMLKWTTVRHNYTSSLDIITSNIYQQHMVYFCKKIGDKFIYQTSWLSRWVGEY